MQNSIMRACFFLLLFLGVSFISQAQESPEMADVMRSNGKIYVVMGCALIILTGLFIYVWSVDRKLTRAEKNFLK